MLNLSLIWVEVIITFMNIIYFKNVYLKTQKKKDDNQVSI